MVWYGTVACRYAWVESQAKSDVCGVAGPERGLSGALRGECEYDRGIRECHPWINEPRAWGQPLACIDKDHVVVCARLGGKAALRVDRHVALVQGRAEDKLRRHATR